MTVHRKFMPSEVEASMEPPALGRAFLEEAPMMPRLRSA